MKYTYPSGTTNKLSIKTSILFSRDLQENSFSGDNDKTYSISLVMCRSTDGPTIYEKKAIELTESILKNVRII